MRDRVRGVGAERESKKRTRGTEARGGRRRPWGSGRGAPLLCACVCVVWWRRGRRMRERGGDWGKVGRGSLGFGRPRGAIGAGWAGLVGPEASWAVAQWGGVLSLFFLFPFLLFFILFLFSFLLF